MKINTGFLVSYDYALLKNAIPLVYEESDSITLAIDKDRRTWSGNTFTIDALFFEWLKTFDTQQKITIYEDDFYDATLNAMQNDTRERNMLAKKMGEGVCIQIDADEYFIDFKGFVNYLKKHKRKVLKSNIQICPYLINIYKVLPNGVLYTKDVSSYYLGTSNPNFVRARKSKDQKRWYVPFLSIHQTWGRTEEELKFKLKNWGHNTDFNLDEYLDFWRSIDETNYAQHKNFHPLNNTSWRTLGYCEGKTIPEISDKLKHQVQLPILKMKVKNFFQNLKFLFK